MSNMWECKIQSMEINVAQENNSQLYGEILGDMEEWEICENEGRAKLVKTYKDMGERMFYFCGDKENPFNNNSKE